MPDIAPSPDAGPLRPVPLTAEAFAPFGAIVGPDQLVLTSTEHPFFTKLVALEPANRPITYLNRHHDHQQVFATLGGRPMLLVVAAPGLRADQLRPEAVHAFVTDGNTAIVFHVDTWHIAPRAVGAAPVRALNVQATNHRAHTERVELAEAFGRALAVEAADAGR